MVFTAGSAAVRVCDHCQTVVARKDASFESLGKVARILDTDSPLTLGASGRYQKVGFRLVGHVQKDHGAGPWDEWFVQLDDGRSAWLSESEGAWHWMFPVGAGAQFLSAMRPGVRVQVAGKPFTVEEVGSARVISAAGELPAGVREEVGSYADATGAGGVFATLDFGADTENPELFVGHAVTPQELAFSQDGFRPKTRAVALAQARCEKCNAPLELRAPDRALRVACPYCGALHEVAKGKLAFLQALKKPEVEPAIPLGAQGQLDGVGWTCVAFLGRSCQVDGNTYPWTEYLLFNKGRGFAWLMESNGHWTFLTPLAAGDVGDTGGGVSCRGQHFKLFQAVTAVTDYVVGECYWAVSVGETAHAREFIRPPLSVNEERTGNEVTFTLSRYLEPKELQQAFPKAVLPRASGICPSQPNPGQEGLRRALPWAAAYMGAALALYLVASALAAHEQVVAKAVQFRAGTVSGAQEAMQLFEGLEIHQRGNVEVVLRAPTLNNDWLGLQGDLFNEESGEVTSFYSEVSHYSGYDSDGAWSEGSREDTEFLSALPKGRYTLRLTPFFQTLPQAPVDVVLVSDVPRFLWVFLVWLALAAWPALCAVRASLFEKQRWEESSL